MYEVITLTRVTKTEQGGRSCYERTHRLLFKDSIVMPRDREGKQDGSKCPGLALGPTQDHASRSMELLLGRRRERAGIDIATRAMSEKTERRTGLDGVSFLTPVQ